MTASNYMNRALRSRDPRYVLILSKLGYVVADSSAGTVVKNTPQKQPDSSLTELRKQYHLLTGKNPAKSWNAETLSAKIADAMGG